MKKKKVYIIGIVGTIGTGLALAFQKAGWQVSGSDQEKVFPPLTDFLAKAGIPFYRGYKACQVPAGVDLVVVGGSALVIDKHNPEYEAAKRKGLPIISHAEAVARFVVKENSLVVAGGYGKTTLTSLLAAILRAAGWQPAYMIGGLPQDGSLPLAFSPHSRWSVVEGDEYQINPYQPRAKFFLYRPRYLLLTAAHWEHPDVYPRAEDYTRAFQQLAQETLARGGLIVANHDGENLPELLPAKKNIIWYSHQKTLGDYRLLEWHPHSDGLEVWVGYRQHRWRFSSPLLGKHNAENIVGAVAMGHQLGIPIPVLRKALKAATGVKRRLEFRREIAGVKIFEDFSQTPPRIRAALAALREHFPHRRLYLVFYPHYSGWRDRSILAEIKGLFEKADFTWITRVHFDRRPREQRVSGHDIALAAGGENVVYMPDASELTTDLCRRLRENSLLVFMTSGDLGDLYPKVASCLEKGNG